MNATTFLIWLALTVALGGLYFLPTIIAFRRGSGNRAAIAVTNLAWGWTVAMWLVCLCWALEGRRRGVALSVMLLALAAFSGCEQGERSDFDRAYELTDSYEAGCVCINEPLEEWLQEHYGGRMNCSFQLEAVQDAVNVCSAGICADEWFDEMRSHGEDLTLDAYLGHGLPQSKGGCLSGGWIEYGDRPDPMCGCIDRSEL